MSGERDGLRGNVAEPKAEYSNRLEKYLKRIAGRDRVHLRVGYAKLLVIAAGLALAWSVLAKHFLSAYWLIAVLAAYLLLTILHGRVLRAKERANTAAEFYRKGIARIEDRWAGKGQTGERFRDANHLYADDLDLFGRGCLFELLSTARLPMGENTLAQWLLFPSPTNEIIERHKLVADLRDRLDLRESVAGPGEALRVRLNPESLSGWAEGAAVMPRAAWRGVAIVLSVASAAALVYGLEA